jgi:hypothetical protein
MQLDNTRFPGMGLIGRKPTVLSLIRRQHPKQAFMGHGVAGLECWAAIKEGHSCLLGGGAGNTSRARHSARAGRQDPERNQWPNTTVGKKADDGMW